jgi:hypothetical protein
LQQPATSFASSAPPYLTLPTPQVPLYFKPLSTNTTAPCAPSAYPAPSPYSSYPPNSAVYPPSPYSAPPPATYPPPPYPPTSIYPPPPDPLPPQTSSCYPPGNVRLGVYIYIYTSFPGANIEFITCTKFICDLNQVLIQEYTHHRHTERVSEVCDFGN